MAFSLSRPAREAGYRLVTFDEVGSTNTEAMARARDGEGGPLWLVAARQVAGKGRRGSVWTAPPGNLNATLLLTVPTPPAVTASLAFAAGLAAREAILRFAPASDPRLKWPNDVLVGGAKIVGILLETESAGRAGTPLAIGIGINVAAAPEGLPYRATSLSALAPGIGAGDVFEALSETLHAAITLWDEGRGLAVLRAQWLAAAAGLGQEITVRAGDTVSHGIFETLDADGRLVLAKPDGQRALIAAGEVHFGAAGADNKSRITTHGG